MKDKTEMLDEMWADIRILFEDIAEQTGRGVIHWELTDYLPLGIIDEDEYDGLPAGIMQSFDYSASIAGLPYTLSIMEAITLDDGKGDLLVSLTRDVEDNFMKSDMSLSMDFDYDDCSPEELAQKYSDNPAMALCNALVPQSVDSDIVKEVMSWARYYNEVDVDKKFGRDKLNRLCKKLFDEHRLLDFHRIVFDIEYRNKLMGERI